MRECNCVGLFERYLAASTALLLSSEYSKASFQQAELRERGKGDFDTFSLLPLPSDTTTQRWQPRCWTRSALAATSQASTAAPSASGADNRSTTAAPLIRSRQALPPPPPPPPLPPVPAGERERVEEERARLTHFHAALADAQGDLRTPSGLYLLPT